MKVMDDDFRIFMALRFAVGDHDYSAQRESLEKASWLVVDAFRAAGFYAVVSSYPKWTNVDDMGDFGMLLPIFPVNGIDCLCVQVQPSPLRESFTDPNSLAQAKSECRKIVAEHGGGQTGGSGFSEVPSESCWNLCVDDFRNAGFTKSMERVSRIEAFKEGILLLSTGGMPSQLEKGIFEAKLFAFWINLISPQPREFGFMF